MAKDRPAVVEAAMSCFCTLLDHCLEGSKDWLQRHQELLSLSLFVQLFAVLFPGTENGQTPRACLAACIFLLRNFPSCARHAAQAGSGSAGKEDTAAFPRIIAALGGETDNDFQASASSAVLCALAGAVADDEGLGLEVRDSLATYGLDEDEVDALFCRSSRESHLIEMLLATSMGAYAELAKDEHRRLGRSGQASLLEEVLELRDRRNELEDVIKRLESDLQQRHFATQAMLPFVRVNSALVEQSLEPLVSHGWDSVDWRKNYTLLHFAAECLDDPNVVQLVGSFSTDLESRDDAGMRPIDYARRNPCKEIAKVLETMRRRKKRQGWAASNLVLASGTDVEMTPSSVSSHFGKKELVAQLESLDGLTSTLRQGIEAVVRHGWERWSLSWPSGFSPLHQAAQEGHSKAVDLLVAARADVAAMDDWQLTPLDYAVQGGHEHVIASLQMHVQEQLAGRAQPPNAQACHGTLSTIEETRCARSTAQASLPQGDGGRAAKVSQWDRGPGVSPPVARASRTAWSAEVFSTRSTGAPDVPASSSSSHIFPVVPDVRLNISAPAVNVPGSLKGSETGTQGRRLPISIVQMDATSYRPGQAPNMRNMSAGACGLPSDVQSACQLSLEELMLKLSRLREENSALLDEKRALRYNGGMGNLETEMLRKYVMQLQAFGRDAVLKKLQELPIAGGLGLDAAESARLLDQVGLMLQICQDVVGGKISDSQGKPSGAGHAAACAGLDDDPRRAFGTAQLDVAWEDDGRGSGRASEAKSQAKSQAPSEAKGHKGHKAKASGGKASGGKSSGKGPPAPPAPPAPQGKGKSPGVETGKTAPESVDAPQKPRIQPGVQMRPLWWSRYLRGVHFKEGETIWDAIGEDLDLPLEALEARFCKNPGSSEGKLAQQEDAERRSERASENGDSSDRLQLLRIFDDPNLVVCKEAAIKQLPPAQKLAQAILQLDEQVIPIDTLQCVLDNICPTPQQVEQLQKAREEHPNLPMAVPEQYMWVLSRIPGFQARLDCWSFARTYQERRLHYYESLRRFEEVLNSIRSSTALPSLLGLILAVGNYLNGGTDRGQADGFDLETLSKLHMLKDQQGKDLRHLILDSYFNQQSEQARTLVEELRPLWTNIVRTLGKDRDGNETFGKRVRILLEDYDSCVEALEGEFTDRLTSMETIVQFLDDPVDKFKMHMPEQFAKAKELMRALVEQRDRTKDSYRKLLKWFRISNMKSSDFCLLWDNLFIPECLITSRPERLKRDFLVPHFCQGRAFALEHLLVLWEFQDPEEQVKTARARRQLKLNASNSQSIAGRKYSRRPWNRTSTAPSVSLQSSDCSPAMPSGAKGKTVGKSEE